MMMKMMMRMKIRKIRYHCQRKQNLIHNNGNGLGSVPVEKKLVLHPSPIQNPQKSAVVSCE
nr:MSTP033 [Homo sapiens]